MDDHMFISYMHWLCLKMTKKLKNVLNGGKELNFIDWSLLPAFLSEWRQKFKSFYRRYGILTHLYTCNILYMYVDVSYLLWIMLCVSLQFFHDCVKNNIKYHYILLLFQICQVEIYCMVLGIGLFIYHNENNQNSSLYLKTLTCIY